MLLLYCYLCASVWCVLLFWHCPSCQSWLQLWLKRLGVIHPNSVYALSSSVFGDPGREGEAAGHYLGCTWQLLCQFQLQLVHLQDKQNNITCSFIILIIIFLDISAAQTEQLTIWGTPKMTTLEYWAKLTWEKKEKQSEWQWKDTDMSNVFIFPHQEISNLCTKTISQTFTDSQLISRILLTHFTTVIKCHWPSTSQRCGRRWSGGLLLSRPYNESTTPARGSARSPMLGSHAWLLQSPTRPRRTVNQDHQQWL